MLLTIITPTYNRADTLVRTYKSLRSQINKQFKWLIVDDGSFDNTEELVKSWCEERKIDIRYLKKSNGGKHTAINFALDNLPTCDLVFVLDSDDWLPIDSVEQIYQLAEKYSTDKIAGFIALKEDLNGKLLSKPFEESLSISSLSALYDKNIRGEWSIIFYSKVLLKFRFPVFKGEKFCTESVLYNMIDNDGYEFGISNKVLTTCEYQEDGLSSNPHKLMVANPSSYALYYYQLMIRSKSIKEFIPLAIRFSTFKKMSQQCALKYKGKYEFIVFISDLIAPIIKSRYIKSANNK